MIKRTIEISQQPVHLAVKNRQLVLKHDGETVRSIPCEDLGLVVVDHPGTTFTHAALSSIINAGASLLLCGRDHLPNGVLLPLADHSQVVWKIRDQLSVKKPLQKQLWQHIVRAKVEAQAGNLRKDSAALTRLKRLAKDVRSGDNKNHEAQAAKVYWSAWLFDPNLPESKPETFRRLREGAEPNSLLNYGYSIMRATVARSLVAAGLLPVLGIHHCNRSNAFCLADDLLEPLRPIVDAKVRELYFNGHRQITTEAKSALLRLMTLTVCMGETTGPLMVAIQRYCSSLAKSFEDSTDQLEIPEVCELTDTAACGS